MNILIKVSYQKTVFCLYQSLITNIITTQMIISITMSFMNSYRLVEYLFFSDLNFTDCICLFDLNNLCNPSKLKAAGKQCRAPPAVDPALGSWDCDFGDKSENTYGGGVSCRLKCNEGYAPVGMDKNVRPTKISLISKNLVVF